MEVDDMDSADSFSSSESESDSEVEAYSSDSASSGCDFSGYESSAVSPSDSSDTEPSSISSYESDTDLVASDPSVDSDTTDDEETPSLKRLAEFRVPLYDGANITILESYLLLYQYALRHSLSKKALSDLLSVLNVHLPDQAKSAPSFYKLKKFFEVHFDDIESTVKYYCTKCHRQLESNSSTCPNSCGSSVSAFLYVPVEPQLKRKLEDPFLWRQLQLRLSRANDGVIHDIYDGQEYRNKVPFIEGKANITFTINADGVAIYRSSKVDLWPIWLQINELPPTQRFSKNNMLLGGLWYSSTKPTMSTFLLPLITSLNKLYSQGILVCTPEGPMRARGMIILCCVDLPAQALILNMKNFNGKFGCAMCEDPGVPRSSCHMHRNWPYTTSNILRTSQSIEQNYRDLQKDRVESVKGIKGASVLFMHSPFDIAKGLAVDSLHVIFLGITKDLLKYWFDKSKKGLSTSIYSKAKICDRRLLSIRTPDRISRAPRTLEDVAHWKGSQLRDWLLYYSIPVLFGVLPPHLFDNYCLLVAAVHIVSSDSISVSDLSRAESMLHRFCVQYPAIYGPDAATMKCHLLRHVASCVRNWGPLWSYSCFAFESMNHTVKKLFHGSRDTSKELAFNYALLQALPSLIVLASCQDKVQMIVKKLRGKVRKSGNGLLDKQPGRLQHTERLLIARQLPTCTFDPNEAVTVGYRLVVDHEVYHSSQYSRVKARNSYTVKYCASDGIVAYGEICFFVSVRNRLFTFIQKLTPCTPSCKHHFHMTHNALDCISVSKILPVCKGDLVCVPVTALVRKCVLIEVNDSVNKCIYVVSFPNDILSD